MTQYWHANYSILYHSQPYCKPQAPAPSYSTPMETLIQADIFFFVTTIFVGVLTVASIIIVIYVVKILHNVQKVSKIVTTEAGHIVGEIEHLRVEMRNERLNLSSLFRFLRNIFTRKKSDGKLSD